MNGFSKSFGNDSIQAKIKELYKGLNFDPQHAKYDIHLSEKRGNIIDVEMFLKNEEHKLNGDSLQKGVNPMQTYMNKMLGGVMLRGSVYEDGTIASFYTVNAQKNLLAMFFELPGKTVKVGDTWPLSVQLISMDQSFICDSSYRKNMIKVVGIEKKDGGNIVTLKYDIVEYVDGYMNSPFDNNPVKTTMKMTYQAVATFSVEKGRWIKYEGVLSNSTMGIMSSETAQKYMLVVE
jgi:hypothetical protein